MTTRILPGVGKRGLDKVAALRWDRSWLVISVSCHLDDVPIGALTQALTPLVSSSVDVTRLRPLFVRSRVG